MHSDPTNRRSGPTQALTNRRDGHIQARTNQRRIFRDHAPLHLLTE